MENDASKHACAGGCDEPWEGSSVQRRATHTSATQSAGTAPMQITSITANAATLGSCQWPHERNGPCESGARSGGRAASKHGGRAYASGLVRLASAEAGTYRRSDRVGCGCCYSRSFATCGWCRAAGSSVGGSAGRRVCLQLVASSILLGSGRAFVPTAVARGRTCQAETATATGNGRHLAEHSECARARVSAAT